MDDVPIVDLMKVAELAARKGGDFAYENRHRCQEVNRRDHHDVKLKMDEETQQVIEDFLVATYPDHSILGEEWGNLDTDADYLWVVDPIDGTMNYFRDIAHWCTSVAVMHRGTVVAGAVFAPEQDELFVASVEEPAVCNGREIRVSDIGEIQAATICTAGLSRIAGSAERLAAFDRLIREASKTRVFGAAALDICFVARGRMDAMYEYGLKLWDVAAAGLIVQQAGGTFEQFERTSDLSGAYFVGNGVIDTALKARIGI